jgi:hypothetical protein
MAPPKAKKSKMTDAQRHKRFVAMAREVQASEDPKEFERAFKKVAPSSAKPQKHAYTTPWPWVWAV